MTKLEEKSLSRRTFMKGSALAGLGAAAVGTASLFGCAPQSAGDAELAATGEGEDAAPVEEKVVWTHCSVNCMSFCAFQCHVGDGEIIYTESDNTGSAELGQPQMRACLRGRSIRRWLNSPERLNYPMKRVGKRGEGKFEQISWDEALDTIVSEFNRIRETYGNEAIYMPQCSGVVSSISPFGKNVVLRLFNCLGGYLGNYGSYSSAQYSMAAKYTYGGGSGSSLLTVQDGELVVLFGNSPADTRMGGTGSANLLAYIKEAKGARVICIDPRMNDTVCGQGNEWIPIRPGTDGALCAALAYEIINNGWADEEFLHTYCVGYDEETLPESARGKHASYKDYILGNGPDGVAKTPAWASAITLIPEQRIVDLAREMHESDPLFVAQGYGPQRRSNGEMTARAIMILPQLLGQIGQPGMSNGLREGKVGFKMDTFPAGDNPVKAKIPIFLYTDAIKNGEAMTATNAGVQGTDKLSTSIKFLYSYAGNCLTNQHSDINATHDILADESLCEFIVVHDVVMTDSAKYADILLPDLTTQEQLSVTGNGYNDNVKAVVFGQPVYEPKFERRGAYEVCCDLAERFGVYDEYTDGGKTREDWNRLFYEALCEENDQLPTWEEGMAMGLYKEEMVGESVAMKDFIADPEANPLETESGKIQIYSEELAHLAETWELGDGDVISPIPAYAEGFEGYQDVTEEYPLLIQGFHYKAHVHSSYANNAVVQAAAPHMAWVNPLDAEERGIKDGDTIKVFNDRGEIHIEAKVTSRIMPGVVALPQGSWHDADMSGDRVDKGGCINTLTTQRPSPLAKGNPQHSNIGQIAKA